jgi:hypothetical protein
VTGSVVERYLVLGLRIGRHADGVVDAYFGPAELSAAVDDEPLTAPAALVSAADSLLGEVGDGWLRDQVVGLRTYAGVLAGESRSYADEVYGCYGVRPAYTDEEVFADAHGRLDALLPGTGPLLARYQAYEDAMRIPAGLVERTFAAAIDEARRQTARLVDLPDGEGVELDIVEDVPWIAYCEYLGGLRSRISVNVSLPISAIELLTIALHETYPGHHAERVAKEHLLVRQRGMLEETLVLAPTPQSLVVEGIGELAPELLLGGEGGAAFAALVDETGFDLAHALAVRRALRPCRWAEVNAALMRYRDGVGDDEIRAYLERWGLLSPELSAHLLRFMSDPTSRTYVITYPAGQDLCGRYVDGDIDRFRRLLTEQVRVGELGHR